MDEGFLFGGISLRFVHGATGSQPNKKVILLRSPCLCGEISILGKNCLIPRRIHPFRA